MSARGRESADAALIAALAGGATLADAARIGGVGERTVARRLAEPDFARAVAEARAAMLARAIALLAEAGAEAAITLRALLGANSEQVKLGACRAILELGVKLRESEDHERRLAALEERAGAEQGGRR